MPNMPGETVYGVSPTDADVRRTRRATFWRQAEKEFSEYRLLLRQHTTGGEKKRKGKKRKLNPEDAKRILLRLARRVVALARMLMRIREVYERHYDEPSGHFYYVHMATQTTQWHKPVGMLPHKDIPMAADALSAEEGQSSLLPSIAGAEENSAAEEVVTFWGRTPQTQAYMRDRYMKGPIFRRSGYMKDVVVCRNNNLVVDKPFTGTGRRIHRQYRDVDMLKAELAQQVVWETKYERHEMILDPYLLTRAAATRGSDVVMRVMRKYPHNKSVQTHGFMQLSTFEYPGTKDGASSYKAVEVIKAVLEVLEGREDEATMLNALQTIVVVSAHYQNRAVLARKGMIEHIVNLFKKVKKDKITMKIGAEERKIETLSPYAISIAYYAIKLAGAYAYDEAHREKVATTCLAGLLHALKVCADESHVLHEGLLALYNFVFLSENCHMFLTEHKVLKTVKKLIDPFTHDKEIMKSGKRCLAALSPNGWRAGLVDA